MTVNPGPGHEPGYDEFYQSGHTPPELRGAVERSHALDPYNPAGALDLTWPAGWRQRYHDAQVDFRLMADLLPEVAREAMEQEEQRWRQLLARLPEVTITLEGYWIDHFDPRADLVHPFTD